MTARMTKALTNRKISTIAPSTDKMNQTGLVQEMLLEYSQRLRQEVL